jgi:hypothetical protein
MKRSGFVQGYVTTEHQHDVVKFLKAFTVFWAYIAFSQFMLIWYANLPEETFWFEQRLIGGWTPFTIALPFIKFVIPFLRQIKAAVFDRINRQDFLSGESLELQRDRISPIRYWFDKQDELEYVIIPRNQDIRDLDHAWEIAEDYYDMSIGIEGMVAKSYNSPYGEKHSDKWIKFKFYTTSDFPIIGIQEGEGRNKGTTGSLLLEIKPSYIDEETGEEIPAITTSSGSGLDLDTANLIWSRKDEIAYLYSIGKPCYAEIKYLGITPDNCLREPIFQRFRDDK